MPATVELARMRGGDWLSNQPAQRMPDTKNGWQEELWQQFLGPNVLSN